MKKIQDEFTVIQVRPAVTEDLEALLRFEQGVIAAERPFDPTIRGGDINYYDIPAMIAAPDVQLLVAEVDGRPVGCGYARIDPARHYLKHSFHAYLGFMYVDPGHRGRGVNALIIAALRQWAVTRGINELYLEVYCDNEPAVKAYEKVGFSRYLYGMRKPV